MTDSPSGQPSQRGPFLVLAALVLVLVVLLGLLAVVGLRLYEDWRADADERGSAQAEESDESRRPAQPGTVRFQVVTKERPLSGGSCPTGKGWTEHEQQCLRLGGGFPARALAEPGTVEGRPVVNVSLRPPADQTLATFTQDVQGQRVALIAKDEVITAPSVTGPITGGKLQIAGDFTTAQAERLADLINGG